MRKTRLSKDLSLNLALSLLPKLPETLKTLSQATEVGGSFKRAAYNFSKLAVFSPDFSKAVISAPMERLSAKKVRQKRQKSFTVFTIFTGLEKNRKSQKFEKS